MLSLSALGFAQQGAGSIRGVVYDRDYDVPLADALVLVVETGARVRTSPQGNYVFSSVAPGKYTLVFSADGYQQQIEPNVLVSSGQLTDVDAQLSGEFTDMDEFVVQDLVPAAAGSEAALLNLRFESAALMDSISSDLMSRAGASDAASALRLVAGASVQDGKSAVIRGLPDRYVSSQMNGVRLPTADEDKRAVELDQFPSVVIESVQVSKTFTPDQQGDASGGAVDVRLKGIPDEAIFTVKAEYSRNSQVSGRDDFLSYAGGGLSSWGYDDGGRDIQYDHLGANWDGAVGTSEIDAPIDYKLGTTIGGKYDLDDGMKLGGLVSVFYERDSSFYDNGIDDSYWVDNPFEQPTPQTNQGQPDPSGQGDYKTALFDVTQGSQSVQWGTLGTVGLSSEHNSIALTYLYTRSAEDKATLAEDTRGKAYFDPTNQDPAAAPYLRLETLEYTERFTQTLQLHGQHQLPSGEFEFTDGVKFHAPELDWTIAASSAEQDQPDKRQFGAKWSQSFINPGGFYEPYKPSATFSLGGLQRIWKDIKEDSDTYAVNLKLPFEQWSGDEGYLKFGAFQDKVERSFNQDTFSNFGDTAGYNAGWNQSWSAAFPSQNHAITASDFDVDYNGDQKISALYGMLDLPVSAPLDVIGGVRFESTEIGIVNHAEQFAQWFPPGSTGQQMLPPGAADVDFQQDDLLPSIGLVYAPVEQVTLRASYAQTVARQTFKEITPIIQQEYLGGPIFIGNPDLGMSSLRNYDLRLDYTPYQGGLVSASVFYKDVTDPIEYVQVLRGITFTTAANYPEGHLSGLELELRQRLENVSPVLEGFALGANATFIQSEVTLTDEEQNSFVQLQAPLSKRDMTNAPDHLFNLYLTYDLVHTGTQAALFYTVQGDTLVAGAGQSTNNFVPDVYATEYDTLNFSVTQELGSHFKLQFQAKNLTNPEIQEVYRSKYIDGDVTKTSHTNGIDYSIALAAQFSF